MSSAVEFGTCSDEKQFRDDLAPLKFEANSFLIYKVATKPPPPPRPPPPPSLQFKPRPLLPIVPPKQKK